MNEKLNKVVDRLIEGSIKEDEGRVFALDFYLSRDEGSIQTVKKDIYII